MKKLLIIFLLFLMMLSGCHKAGSPAFAAVLTRSEDDSAVIIVTDENGNEIFHKDIEFPAEVYFGEQAVYYTTNHRDYKSYKYASGKRGDEISDISGTIIYHAENIDTYTYSGINVMVYSTLGGSPRQIGDVLMVNHIGDRFYVVRGDRSVDVYSDKAAQHLYTIESVSTNYLSCTEINGKTYMVTDKGYISIPDNDEELMTTYIYTQQVDQINAVRGDVLSFYCGQHIKNCRISFDAYRMVMEEMPESKSYGDAEFKAMFPEYYEKGYCVDYFEILGDI